MQRLESFSEDYNARTISALADYARDHVRNYDDWKDSLKMIDTRIKMLSGGYPEMEVVRIVYKTYKSDSRKGNALCLLSQL